MKGVKAMNRTHHGSGAGRSAGDQSARLSLEQLEPRNVPSFATMQVAAEIVHSTESYADMITADYTRFLNRAPDAVGFNSLLRQMQNGVAPEVIEAEFVSSPEYISNHGGVASTWINGLYHDLLGRLPTTPELSFWNFQLATGATTNQIALAFTTSVERDAIVVSNDYFTLLGRAPDTAGLNFFVSALRSGADRNAVESVIVGSNEFVQRHGNNMTSFVISAYQDVLHRTPNSAEINLRVNELIALGSL